MTRGSNNIQLQYQGYLNTPLLWRDQVVFGLKQLELPDKKIKNFKGSIPDKLVLGKRVEKFVIEELKQNEDIEILLENVQIQDEKITIGEIDCLIKRGNIGIHVEIVYKFYLYDPSIGDREIDHWIGPNRNDTLMRKLTKLRDKQLPLIENKHAKSVLDKVKVLAENLQQRVFFKAQLFAPFKESIGFELLNKDCLKGFYVYASEIAQFSSCEFYLPIKFDWLVEVYTDVEWISFEQFSMNIGPELYQKKSQLCWIKFPDGVCHKFFVVWWKRQ